MQIWCFISLFLLESLHYLVAGGYRGEGYHFTMEVVRPPVVPAGGKLHGRQPRCGFDQIRNPISVNISTTKKRSLRRAYARAQIEGFSMYKGKVLLAPSAQQKQQAPKVTISGTPSKSHLKSSRFSLMSWNIGGMSTEKYDQVVYWLGKNSVQVALLQETHWYQTAEWTCDMYHVIHTSSGKTKSGGLMCLVSTSWKKDQISWRVLEEGRLLHVRLHGHSRCIDIINGYQYTIHTKDQTCRDNRKRWVDQLDTLLLSLPKRNLLYLGVDLNTSLQQRSSVVGIETFHGDNGSELGTKHADSNQVHSMLKKHGLVALNTWTPRPPTFTSHNASSRIDYIFTRSFTADMVAKDVRYLLNHPLYALTGPRHCPLLTSVRSSWHYKRHSQHSLWTVAMRRQLYAHYKSQDSQWSQIQHDVNQCFHQLLTDMPTKLLEIHKKLQTAVHPLSRPQDVATDTDLYAGSTNLFKQFQDCTTILRSKRWQSNSEDLQTCFDVWRMSLLHDKLKMQIRQNSKKARKDKVQQVMHQAKEAEQAKDQYTFYQCIRQLAPKQPYKRIMMRGDNGELLSPAASADQLAAWIKELYAGPDLPPPSIDQMWPLTEEELTSAFRHFSNTKALSPEYIPATVWKANADSAAACIHQFAMTTYHKQPTPEQWSEGNLVFLAKPGKSPTKASNLRPIALLEPSGKAILGIISQKLIHACWHHLCSVPQFAYLAHRSSLDAINRVALHCQMTQQLQQQFLHPLQMIAYGQHVPKLFGGVMICLDLTKAFDCVKRDLLLEAMHYLDAPDEMIALVHRLYAVTSFKMSHRGETRHVRTKQGVRQGCRAAPTLWSLYTTYIIQYLGALTNPQWVRDHVTVYADDWIIHDHFSSISDAEIIFQRVGALLSLLDRFGLKTNDKTVALLHVNGRQTKVFRKMHLTSTKDACFINIPKQDDTCVKVKIVDSHPYLGVTLHHTKLEHHTMKSRIKQSVTNSYLLQKWLGKGSALNLKQKLKVWYQCIFTSATYGIFHAGLSNQTLHLLDIFCFRQLRRICQSPIHITRQSNRDFLAHFRLADPIQVLLDRCTKTLQSNAQRLSQLCPTDILFTSTDERLKASCETLYNFLVQRQGQGSPTLRLSPLADFTCVLCPKTFNTVADLRGHQTKVHGILPGPIRIFDGKLDSVDGLPICTRCNMEFADWKKLHHHVTWTCLQARPLDRPDLTEFQKKQALFRDHVKKGVNEIIKHKSLSQYFTQRCLLCNRWTTGGRSILNHHLAEHATAYSLHLPKYMKLLQDTVHLRQSHQKCQLCGKEVQKTHTCVILKQIAMMMADRTLDEEEQTEHHYGDGDNDDDLPRYVCQTCGRVFMSKQGLDMHAISHVAPEHGFDAARDVTANNCCAHCGNQYSCTRAVMRHLQMEKCEHFDPNRRLQTMVEEDSPLRSLVEAGDFAGILKNPEWTALFGKTCGLCQKTFTLKNSLSQHLQGVHAPYWDKAAPLAGVLTARYQTVMNHCFCIPKARIRDRHQCVIFKQMALLRIAAFPHLDNTSLLESRAKPITEVVDKAAIATREDSTLPTPLVQARKLTDYFQCRSDTFVDQLSDDSLAQILQKMLTSDDTVSAETTVIPQVPVEDPMNSMYGTLFPLIVGRDEDKYDDYRAQMLCTQLNTSQTRRLIQMNLDELMAESWVAELASKCSMCDIHDTETKFPHITWTHLIHHVHCTCAEISTQTLGRWLEDFLSHPKLSAVNVQDNTLALQQIFLVRFLYHFGKNGGRWQYQEPAEGDVAASSPRRDPSGKETRPRAGIVTKRVQETQASEQHHRNIRPRLEEHGKAHGLLDHQARGSDCHTRSSGQMDFASRTRSGIHCSEITTQEPTVAAEHEQDGSTPPDPSSRNDQCVGGKTPAFVGHHSGDNLLCHSSAGEASDTGRLHPISSVGRQNQSDNSLNTASHPKDRDEPDATEGARSFSRSPYGDQAALDEEAAGGPRSRELHPMVSDHQQSGPLRPLGPICETFLQCHLATGGHEDQTCQTTTELNGKLPGQATSSAVTTYPKTSLRILVNPTGVFCYINSTIQGLVWMAIRMYAPSSYWKDGGVIFEAATQLTPSALDVSSHTGFQSLLNKWGISYNLKRQHDATEFLNYLVTEVQPVFWSSDWTPRWSIGSDAADGEYEKGTQFATIQLSLTEGNFDTDSAISLADLIADWHDAKVHQRGLITVGQSFAFAINRISDLNAKVHTEILLPENMMIAVPTHSSTEWPIYPITGVTMHRGNSIESGHYQTSVFTADNRWFHYDDAKIPTQGPLNLQDRKDISIIWISGICKTPNIIEENI